MLYIIESLKEYKKKNRLSDREIARRLEVHFNSIYRWITLGEEPSTLAKSKIRQFLIHNM